MEDAAACCNDWRTPVLHDAITAAVMCCRHNYKVDLGTKIYWEECSNQEKADAAFAVLQRILAMGANVHAKESLGASCVWRLCRTAEDILPGYAWDEHRAHETAIVTPAWQHDLERIFLLLKKYEADFHDPEIQSYRQEKNHPLRPFLERVEAESSSK